MWRSNGQGYEKLLHRNILGRFDKNCTDRACEPESDFVNHVSSGSESVVQRRFECRKCGRPDARSGDYKGTGMRVLLIEDDSAVAQSIELMLKSESFNVYTTDLGEEGVDLGKLYDYDIILPGLAGIEDKVKGLGVGADDYMTKPFHKDELVARIHAIVRRSKGHAQSVIQTGDLVVNLDTKTVEVGGQRVHLTGKEYQMLELLSLRKGTTLTKEMFLNHLYGGMDEPELKIIDVFICKLRKKLANASEGRNFIETVWGRGYVLREPHEHEERIPA